MKDLGIDYDALVKQWKYQLEVLKAHENVECEDVEPVASDSNSDEDESCNLDTTFEHDDILEFTTGKLHILNKTEA